MKSRIIIILVGLAVIAGAAIFAHINGVYDFVPDRFLADASPAPADFEFGAHPRILMSNLAAADAKSAVKFFQNRYEQYKSKGINAYDVCNSPGLLAQTSCWLKTGDDNLAAQIVSKMRDFEVVPPQEVTHYGNAWELAIAYDLMAISGNLSNFDRVAIETKLAGVLATYIQILNGNSASLWHGRTTLAARAWICAVVLDKLAKENQDLIRAAGRHFLESLKAASLTEAWPEGYNYWIQERAMDFTLAAVAYLNATKDEEQKKWIIHTLRRIGLWHIYSTRPDNRIEGYGDEGSRVDLKDQTRPIIDLIGQVTRDPVFALYSRYLQHLFGSESYYSDFRWSFPLFNDPTVDLVDDQITSLQRLEPFLPKSDLFGAGAYNQLFIHSDWSPGQTFISFRAGGTFTHHGHYDAGHFTLFKGAPLAINSSVYGNIFSENRLYYSVRTIAKNSLLILRPGEVVHPNRLFKKNVADGGQRVIIPTGSDIQSVEDWKRNLYDGKHYEGGQLMGFSNSDPDFVYISADLTDAYNTPDHDEGGEGGKVTRVTRELAYLTNEDILFVHDQVTATDSSYTKKWLLHTINQPVTEDTKVLKGTPQNGILESRSNTVLVNNKNNFLTVKRFLPKDAVIRMVGGEDYRYYVESDGDETLLDGENFSNGAVNKPWFDNGMWRIEIQPGGARKHDEFLVGLEPGIGKPRQDKLVALAVSKNASGVITPDSAVLFAHPDEQENIEFNWPGPQSTLYLFGAPEKGKIQINDGVKTTTVQSDASGAIKYKVQKPSENTHYVISFMK